jgi:hypothetical protein
MPPDGIRTRDPSKRAAADPHLIPLGHFIILIIVIIVDIFFYFLSAFNLFPRLAIPNTMC